MKVISRKLLHSQTSYLVPGYNININKKNMYISQNNNTTYAYSIYKQFGDTLYYRSGFPFTVMAEDKNIATSRVAYSMDFYNFWV